jgi:hypothetical protein
MRTFAPFRHLPNVRWDDPQLRFVDLDGDGLADVLVPGTTPRPASARPAPWTIISTAPSP